MHISDSPTVPADALCESNSQVKIQLSRSASRALMTAKEILETRGLESVSTEDLVRACLEENQPLDLASIYLEHRLKQKGTSICEF
ncbi:hypothetical protein J6187_004473 [Salmonella enterica]|nr:hypothetical protein [Salmonella enterica]EHG9742472.1 hypothetical protein [Salmonella enterica]